MPKNAAQAKRLIKQYTRSPPTAKPKPAPDAEQVRAALFAAARSGRLVAGWPQIAEAISSTVSGVAEDEQAYLLFGVFHDSAPQIDAFARLAGPLGVAGVHTWALELFDAPGRWRGLTERAAEQSLLDRIAASAHLREPQAQSALQSLKKQQRQTHYAAWKYDYLQTVLELPGRAKVAGQRIQACDTPSQIQQRMMDCCGEAGLQLRDLHCALTLRSKVQRPGVVALLWGQAHLQSDQLPRFLPASAALHRVYVFGARQSEFGAEVALARRLAISGPLWVPWGKDRSILLLDGPKLQANIDRVRTEEELPASDTTLLWEGPPGSLYWGGEKHVLKGEGPWTFSSKPGSQALLFEHPDWALAIGIELPDRGRTRLEVEDRRSARMLIEAGP